MNILKKFYKILEPNHKYKICFLIFLSLIGMVLETLGIGMILPLLLILTRSKEIPTELNEILMNLDFDLSSSSSELILLLCMMSYFLIKFIFLLYLSFKQNSFVYRLQAQLSTLMFKGYLLSPYKFHLKRNTSELIRNVIGEVHQFTGAIHALLVFITEVFVLIGIITLLIFVEPYGAIVSFVVLGLSGLLFDKLSKKYVKNWGFERQKHEGIRLKHLNQGLNAYKEIKIAAVENSFLSKFDDNTQKAAEVEIKANILSATPKLGLELLAVIGVFLLIFVSLNQGNSINEIVPIIAVFGVAAFRIMPSVNRLINTGQVVRYHLAVILMLEKEITYFKSLKKKEKVNSLIINEIEVKNLSFRYEGNKTYTLKNLNFKINKNEFIGIIGKSGSGKSTFINLMLGLLDSSKGTIKTNNYDIKENISEWQNEIGYVPQDVYLLDDTIRNNIAFGLNSNKIDNIKINKAIKLASLEIFLKELPQGLDTVVGEKGDLISGGQRQRIGLARAFYNEPQLLILDEATSALDIDTEKSIISNLKKLSFKPIILMITHREKSLSMCDHIFEFKDTEVRKKLIKGQKND